MPVYHLPANADQIEVMRIVVRAHFNRALASAFLHDLEAAVQRLACLAASYPLASEPMTHCAIRNGYA